MIILQRFFFNFLFFLLHFLKPGWITNKRHDLAFSLVRSIQFCFTSFLFRFNHSVTVYVCFVFFFHFIFFRQKGVVRREKKSRQNPD